MSANKKRKADSGAGGAGGGFPVALLEEGSGGGARVKKKANHASPNNSKLKKVSNQQFLDDKKSIWQQAMEELNERTKPLIAAANTDEDMYYVAMEYLRQRDMIQQKYNPNSGQVVAMGSDDSNQLGVSTTWDEDKKFEYTPTLVRMDVGNNAVHVACGGLHSLVLSDDGRVHAFGVNDDNAIGLGKIDEQSQHVVKPITKGFDPEDQNTIVAIDAGDSHSVFLSLRGAVYQCGMYKDVDSGKFRDVPIGSTTAKAKGSNVYPTKVQFPTSIRAIAAGESWNAAISTDGECFTWGMGHFGQLARSKNMGANIIPPEKGNENVPVIYELGKMWIGEEYETGEFEKAEDGTLKLDENGQAIPIMNYRYFQDLIQEKFLTPAPVCWAELPKLKRTVFSVACGQLFLLAVARDGSGYDTSVYSAGNNGFGQLGHGDKYERHELTVIKKLEKKCIKKVAAGTSHALALDMTGNAVFGWGRSDYGQVGHSDDVKSGDVETSPQQVAFPKSIENVRIRDISAGYLVSMAITEENDVYTWGFGESSATGHSGDDDVLRPKKLDVLKKNYGKTPGFSTNCHVLEAAGGAQHSLMIVKRFA